MPGRARGQQLADSGIDFTTISMPLVRTPGDAADDARPVLVSALRRSLSARAPAR